MTDRFSGLTRRVNAHVFERETSEELSHLLEEAKEEGGDAADAVVELGTAPEDDEPVLTKDDPAVAANTPVIGDPAVAVTDEEAGLDAVVEDDEDEDAEETAVVGEEEDVPPEGNSDAAEEDAVKDSDPDGDGDDDSKGDHEEPEPETVDETAAKLSLGEVNII
jgi:hypothetical protein